MAVESWVLHEATEADTATILALVLAAFEEYRGQLDPPSGAHAETLDSIREKMRSAQVVLACVEGKPVGCLFCQSEEDHLYLFRLAVLPEHRRNGLGRALVEHAERRARELGFARVRLGVRTALERQRAYYERQGYRQVRAESHPGYETPTYLILEKALTKS
jgi:ribosomal protein S18 acetylase RimI-like enzyme